MPSLEHLLNEGVTPRSSGDPVLGAATLQNDLTQLLDVRYELRTITRMRPISMVIIASQLALFNSSYHYSAPTEQYE